jgi:hypothetical protein
MTAADQIAADLRDAFRGLLADNAEAHVITRAAIRAVCDANDFDNALTRALAAIVALDDAEAAASAEVKAAQARMATVTEANAKAREALRLALEACGGPGAAIVQTEHHTARLNPGGKRVEITDEKALPYIYWRVKQEPDKALVKALLAQGKTIAGAALVQSPPSLVITAKDR